MESNANWADVPPGHVGPTIVDDAAAEDDTLSINANISSGLSDVVGEIDLHIDEERESLLNTPPPSDPQEFVPDVIVPVSTGLLPTDLPPNMLAIDQRVTVPLVTATVTSATELQMIPNDFKPIVVKTEPSTTTTTTSTTTTTPLTVSNPPSETPQVILTHTKPSVLANLQAGRPSLNAPVLIGEVSDYAASIPSVPAWKFVPNPPGVIRMPFRGLEQHVRQRLTQSDRTKLQMSAHRKRLSIFIFRKFYEL